MKLRLAGPRDSNELARIAHACADELQDSFTMRLGLRFQQVYYAVLMKEPSTVVVCSESDDANHLSGFALATLDSNAMLNSLRQSRLSLAIACIWGLMRRPGLIVGLLRRASCLLRSKGVDQYVSTEGAKVSFLAVDPQSRNAFAGPKLMKAVLKQMRERGANDIDAEVDESNPRVIVLHRRLGAELIHQYVTPNNVKRVIVRYRNPAQQEVA